jgi:hypothetical protein
VLRHREQVNRGAGDRPLSAGDIGAKFETTAGQVLPPDRVAAIAAAVAGLDGAENVAGFAAELTG